MADQTYEPAQYQPAQPARKPRKKRHIFLWVFLTVQVIFIIWLIAGTHSSVNHLSAHTAADCRAHNNYFFKSLQDCVNGSNSATEVGTAIGAGLVIAFWAVVDIILGVSYGVYKLARR